MSAPDGWDDEIPPAVLAGAREMRITYLALQMAGFTTQEAATIIAAILANQQKETS